MEPGIPDPTAGQTRLGKYNLDPAVRFWATPPVHGILRPTVVHPADFTFKLPDHVPMPRGRWSSPWRLACMPRPRLQVQPGDLAVVIGAARSAWLRFLAALAAGCSRVIVSDVHDPKLELASRLGAVLPVNVRSQKLTDVVRRETDGWGADLVFECSGYGPAMTEMFDLLCPGGKVALVGIPLEPFAFDVSKAQVKEARIEPCSATRTSTRAQWRCSPRARSTSNR